MSEKFKNYLRIKELTDDVFKKISELKTLEKYCVSDNLISESIADFYEEIGATNSKIENLENKKAQLEKIKSEKIFTKKFEEEKINFDICENFRNLISSYGEVKNYKDIFEALVGIFEIEDDKQYLESEMLKYYEEYKNILDSILSDANIASHLIKALENSAKQYIDKYDDANDKEKEKCFNEAELYLMEMEVLSKGKFSKEQRATIYAKRAIFEEKLEYCMKAIPLLQETIEYLKHNKLSDVNCMDLLEQYDIANIYIYLIICQNRLNDYRDSLNTCKDAMITLLGHPDAISSFGGIYIDLIMDEEAREFYDMIPDDSTLTNDSFKYCKYIDLAWISSDDAAEAFDKATETSDIRLFEEAIEHYTSAIKIDDNFHIPYQNRAWCKLKQSALYPETKDKLGRLESAMEDINKSIEIKKDNAGSHNIKAQIYLAFISLGKDTDSEGDKCIDLAREAINKADTLHSQNKAANSWASTLKIQGSILALDGDKEGAIEKFKESLRECENKCYGRSLKYSQRRYRIATAIETIRLAKKIAPNDGDFEKEEKKFRKILDRMDPKEELDMEKYSLKESTEKLLEKYIKQFEDISLGDAPINALDKDKIEHFIRVFEIQIKYANPKNDLKKKFEKALSFLREIKRKFTQFNESDAMV